ncbi:hypothetical protein REPUB_Repub05bG0053500 [Reevesia pubescens]
MPLPSPLLRLTSLALSLELLLLLNREGSLFPSDAEPKKTLRWRTALVLHPFVTSRRMRSGLGIQSGFWLLVYSPIWGTFPCLALGTLVVSSARAVAYIMMCLVVSA